LPYFSQAHYTTAVMETTQSLLRQNYNKIIERIKDVYPDLVGNRDYSGSRSLQSTLYIRCNSLEEKEKQFSLLKEERATSP
jgi:hypothetical protein